MQVRTSDQAKEAVMRKDGNEKARKLFLSRPERNKGVSLEYDSDLKAWIKAGTERFNERLNKWEPLP